MDKPLAHSTATCACCSLTHRLKDFDYLVRSKISKASSVEVCSELATLRARRSLWGGGV